MKSEMVTVRMPKESLSSIIGILQGLGEVLPDASKLQASIEVLGARESAEGDD